MREEKFHIYNSAYGMSDPLCYFENDDDEWGMVLDFDTEESAERFIQSAINSGDRTEAFFENVFIERTVEICEGGYIDATNMYLGDDRKLHNIEE